MFYYRHHHEWSKTPLRLPIYSITGILTIDNIVYELSVHKNFIFKVKPYDDVSYGLR